MNFIMLKIIVLIVFASLTFSLKAQDSLFYDQEKERVVQNGQVLSRIDFVNIIQPNKTAFKHLQASTDSKIFSEIMFSLSGFSLGYTLGYFLVSQKIPRIICGVGLGTLTGGILLGLRSKNQFDKSLDVYNSSLGLTMHPKKPIEFKLGINQFGIGLGLTF